MGIICPPPLFKIGLTDLPKSGGAPRDNRPDNYKYWKENDPTWASVRPRLAASSLLSGLVIYFCIWKRFSNPFRCRWENTARVHDFFRFPFPIGFKWWGPPWCMGKNPGPGWNKSGGRTNTKIGNQIKICHYWEKGVGEFIRLPRPSQNRTQYLGSLHKLPHWKIYYYSIEIFFGGWTQSDNTKTLNNNS